MSKLLASENGKRRALHAEIERLTKVNAKLHRDVATLEARISELEQRCESQRALLKHQLRALLDAPESFGITQGLEERVDHDTGN